MITINLIGSGNLGWHLLNAFLANDSISVNQWVVRSESFNLPKGNDIDIVKKVEDLKDADITIIAVSDDAIKKVSSSIPFEDQLVVHTSGSVGIHDLDAKHRRGVFYPLQSFSKDRDIDFKDVPLCLEVLDKSDLEILRTLAITIGSEHYKINTEQRQSLHLAAVFVNNFVNHLYRIGHEISDAKSINFDILKPLIFETARKIETLSPYRAQTGPAKRGDEKTIKRHLKQLEDESHKDLYETLTKAIQQTHGRKKL